MLSFLWSYLKWTFSAFLVLILFSYLVEVKNAFQHGAGFLDSLLWFKVFTEELSSFESFLSSFGMGYVTSAFVSVAVFWRWIERLERLENLQERIRKSKAELKKLGDGKSKLEGEISNLKEEKENYQSDVEKLSQEIEKLSKKKAKLLSSIKSLEEKKEKLASYLQKEFRKGYEAGREKGYQSVITELRSLRIQKSALLKLFDSNRELKAFFKKITGKTIRQYLNEAKKQVKSSGGSQ